MDITRVFKSGGSQAVRMPRKYRIDSNEVYIKKFEDIIMLIPKNSGWKMMEKAINHFTDDFMNERNQAKTEKRTEIE